MVKLVMQFIDTHIHLQDFKADFAPQVLENLSAKKLVVISAQEADFAKIATMAERYSAKIVPAFGVHPWYWQNGVDVELLREYLAQFPNALVGEIGVDGIKSLPNDEQHQLFDLQLALAKKFSRPVCIHAAKAFAALLAHDEALKKVKFVHHGFVKNRELIKFINSCGGYFGLGAHFLRQKGAADMLVEMPRNRILFETDAPYQVSDEGYLLTVRENLEKLSVISGISLVELEELLLQNAEDFLRC